MTVSSVPLPDFTSEGRSAAVVVSESARTNAGRTLDIIDHRLATNRDGRWLDHGSVNGSQRWSISELECEIEIELQNLHDRLGQSSFTTSPAIVVVLGDFIALKVDCRRTQALALQRTGPSATTAWAVAACRLALEHGRPGQKATWSPDARTMVAMRSLHEEDMRYEQGWIDVVHPSRMSHAGIGVSTYDDQDRVCCRELIGRDAAFVPERPCRLIARSRQGAGGTRTGAAYAVQLLAPKTLLTLEKLDPMQILRLLARSVPPGRTTDGGQR